VQQHLFDLVHAVAHEVVAGVVDWRARARGGEARGAVGGGRAKKGSQRRCARRGQLRPGVAPSSSSCRGSTPKNLATRESAVGSAAADAMAKKPAGR
jgi:hypothetical protein